MNFLEELKKAEPNVSQIARDSGLSRQAVHAWKDGHIPSFEVFASLRKMEKYKSVLFDMDYNALRKVRPVGRPPLSK
ncbi:hypothetical protein [Vibrio phage LP.1]|nr:hypothetical protein [Vibrio phage LP.1]